MIKVKGLEKQTGINNGDVLIDVKGEVFFVAQVGYGKCKLFGQSFNRLVDSGTFEKGTNVADVEKMNYIKIDHIIKAGTYDITIQVKENN